MTAVTALLHVHGTMIGGVLPLGFLLNVMCPAAVIRLIQQDETRAGRVLMAFT